MDVRLLPLLALFACAEDLPTEGTFVGNPPHLSARYVDNPGQVGLGGELVTSGTAIEPCSGDTINLGVQTFTFVGNEATLEVDLPDEDVCGIRINAVTLAIEVDDVGVQKRVVGQDFDLVVDSQGIPAGENLVLELGDADWLPGFLPLAPAGETLLNSQSDPALRDAFFDGLEQDSSFTAERTL